jgi:hypothetical protein
MKRTIILAMLLIVGLSALYIFRYSFSGFRQWNMERISDSTDWSYYLESYSNGLYIFRHDNKLFTVSCAWDGDPKIGADGKPYFDPKGLAEVSCDELKSMVGMQLVGQLGPGEILLKTVDGATIKILSVRQVN